MYYHHLHYLDDSHRNKCKLLLYQIKSNQIKSKQNKTKQNKLINKQNNKATRVHVALTNYNKNKKTKKSKNEKINCKPKCRIQTKRY